MGELIKTKQILPPLIQLLDEAYCGIGKSYSAFAVAAYNARESQQYVEMGFKRFDEFMWARYKVRRSTAYKLADVGGLIVVKKVDPAGIGYSKLKLIAGHINEFNKDEILQVAKKKKYEDFKKWLYKREDKKPLVGRLVFNFYDEDAWLDANEGLELAFRKVGVHNYALAFKALVQEFRSVCDYEALEMPKMMDPTSLKVYIRDGWRCCVPDCESRVIERHSELAPHSKATPDQCASLCPSHHRRVTAGKARIEILAPGRIKYFEKE